MDRPKQLPPTEILLPEDGGWIPLGVFSYHDREFRYIDADGRKIIKEQFVEAAKRAAKANFELIELHWAHGYLFHQYLSSENINAGEGHGGPLENRIKFPLEVFAAVRKAVPDIPLGVRVSFGYKIIDVQKEIEINRIVAGEIAREGADYIAISDRGLPGDTVAERREMHSLALERIRSVAPSLPIMAVGGFGDLHTISDFYSKGISDMFAIGRTLLWNPMLIHEWRHQVGLPYLGPEVYKFSFKGTTNFGPS
jgi:2,4-dienoyl-CoA reductase-like NADH-dependent reductase (Old Yellow Enzyme family)